MISTKGKPPEEARVGRSVLSIEGSRGGKEGVCVQQAGGGQAGWGSQRDFSKEGGVGAAL